MKRKVIVGLLLVSVCMASFATATSEGAAAEKRVLEIEVFDRGNAPAEMITNSPAAQYVNSAWGEPNNVEVVFVPVPRNQEVEKLNVMMAAGDAPDICYTYDDVVIANYARQGGLADLTDLLETNGTTLKAIQGPDVLEYGTYDGKVYAIPQARTVQGIWGTWIRKDWLDKVGLSLPTNKEEYLEALRAFKEKDPGNVGENLAPMALSDPRQAQFWGNIVYSYYEPATERQRAGWIGSGSTQNDISIPGAKEGFRAMNLMYLEGLLSNDWALQSGNADFNAKAASGYVGSFTGNRLYLWGYKVMPSIKENDPDAYWVPIDPFTNDRGETPKMRYNPTGIRAIVPSFSDSADLAIDYLNWACVRENRIHIGLGVEGTHYDRNEDGIIIPRSLPVEEAWEAPSTSRFYLGGSMYADQDTLYKSYFARYLDEKYDAEMFATHYRYIDKDGIINVRLTSLPESFVKLLPTLKDKAIEIIVKSIMAPAGQFDRIFDAGLEEYEDLGATKVRADLIAAYDAQ